MAREPKRLNIIAYALSMESKILGLEPRSNKESISRKDVVK